MKRKLLALSALLVCALLAAFLIHQKQKQCVVYCIRETLPKFHNDDLSCNLYLMGNKYWITLYDSGDEIDLESEISYGTVSKKKGMFFLRDHYTGFETVMSRGSSLVVNRSFPFLEGKHFVFLVKDNYTDWIHSTADNSAQKEKVYNDSRVSPAPKSLQYGVYQTTYSDFEYKLKIEENGHFQLFLDNLLLSEGMWVRNGNVLELQGDGFSAPYYLLIDDGKLVGVLATSHYRDITEQTLYSNWLE